MVLRDEGACIRISKGQTFDRDLGCGIFRRDKGWFMVRLDCWVERRGWRTVKWECRWSLRIGERIVWS